MPDSDMAGAGETEGRAGIPVGPPGAAYPSPVYAWYVLSVLLLVYILAYVDRQILAYMVEPIKRDMSIGDTGMSLLLGFAFVALYTVAGLPIARLADSGSRRNIIAGGVVVWSLSTAACGFARNFWQIFLARMGVGLGEACLNPAAIPLLADYFEPHRLGRAMGVYMLAIPVGSGLASMLGGSLISRFSEAGLLDLPVVGEVAPWRLILALVGVSGLLIFGLLMTVREPLRHGSLRRDAKGLVESLPLREIGAWLGRHWLVLSAMMSPLLVSALMNFGVGYWIPSFFLRSFDLNAVGAGRYLVYWGVVNLVFGAIGVLGGGLLSDWLSSRYRGGQWGALLLGTLLMGGGYTMFSLMPDPLLSVIVLAPATLGNGILQASGITALMKLVPNQMRGQLAALAFFLVNIFGAGLGPVLIALLTDGVYDDPAMLKFSLFWVALAATLGALALLRSGFGPYLAMLEDARDRA